MDDSNEQQQQQQSCPQNQQQQPGLQRQQAQLRVLQGVEGTDKLYCLPAAGTAVATVVFFVGDQLEAKQLPPRVLELQANLKSSRDSQVLPRCCDSLPSSFASACVQQRDRMKSTLPTTIGVMCQAGSRATSRQHVCTSLAWLR